jgi:hypothetical protein
LVPDWQYAILLSLYKGDGLRTDPSNYRMLAMMSTVAKAFEIILECRLVRWLDRVGGSLTFEVDSALAAALSTYSSF